VSTRSTSGRVCAAGHDFRGSLVQPAQESTLRERLLNYTKTRPRRFRSASGASLSRKASRLSAPGHGASGRPVGGGEKGVYHINAVDQVTQWQVVAQRRASRRPIWSRFWSTCCISSFSHPWFSYDNGSEFINRMVAGCSINCASNRPRAGLGKAATTAWWRPRTAPSYANTSATDTSTRPCRHNQQFYREYLNPYLNYHRLAPRRCRDRSEGPQAHPLQALSNSAGDPVVVAETGTVPARWTEHQRAQQVAAAISDTDAARRMQQAKAKLFERLRLTA